MRDVQDQLGTYWSSIEKRHPAPDADKIMSAPAINGAEAHYVTNGDQPVMPISSQEEAPIPSTGGWVFAVAAVVVAVVAVGGMYLVTRSAGLAPATDDVVETTIVAADSEAPVEEAVPTTVPVEPEVAESTTPPAGSFTAVVPSDALIPPGPGYIAATGGTPLPDIAGATLGDAGGSPLPLGVVTEAPGGIYLDFLFEFPCGETTCFRDAVFKDVNDPGLESGPFPSGNPFHVRHGFVNDAGAPLGEGFDVALYVFPMDQPGEFEGLGIGETVRYTSDYVIRGETEQCGPTYNSQTGAVSCEWFVHEFPEGLPDGRFALWAVWEAPCSAWVEMGYTQSCANPGEVVSFFSSGVDSPFGEEMMFLGEEGPMDELGGGPEYELVPDASGAAATGGTPEPDIVGETLGDSGTGPMLLGVVTQLPSDDYLDFLFEFCPGQTCFRDAHFTQPGNPIRGAGGYESGRPFIVRHGFVNDAAAPLGEGFDVALYVFPMDQPGEFEGFEIGETVRYTSDYVIRGETEQCGPTYRSQTGAVSCEWFVHEFPEGLPDGRFALWAVWEAPCSAWVEMGFTESCADPNEVMSFFSSGVDSPFGDFEPDYGEVNEARR
jgi:hypothetical protein